ncbi:hypothetical protein AwWohl_01200 [Gammaproteobacteria bacterium]|nr:hypothetical protein AwWohl_01200 [Gammaproteobacteria bacterium]
MTRLLSILLILSISTISFAENQNKQAYIDIISIAPYMLEDQLYLDLNAKIILNQTQIEILRNGIPLTFALETVFKRERLYFFNEILDENIRKFELSYHTLSNQYLITYTNINMVKSFPNLSLALDFMSNISNIPIGSAGLIQPKIPKLKYLGLIKLGLDINSLPTPMLIPAYFSKDWSLSTPWTSWEILL